MDWKEEEILVIVKVYPAPSTKYGEVVCTAGITKGGKLIRLYPVPYRDLPRAQQFKKFQWIKNLLLNGCRDLKVTKLMPLPLSF